MFHVWIPDTVPNKRASFSTIANSIWKQGLKASRTYKLICTLHKLNQYFFIKMKYFKKVRKNLATCLYDPNQTGLFHKKRLMVSFTALLVIGSLFMSFIGDVDNMIDFVYLAYFISAIIGAFCSFIHTSIKTPTIFVLIDDDLGGLIERGESNIHRNFLQYINSHFNHLCSTGGPRIERKLHWNKSIGGEIY